TLKNRGHPEDQSVAAEIFEESGPAEKEHGSRAQGLAQSHRTADGCLLFGESCLNPLLLLRIEPRRVARPVWQVVEGGDAEQDGGNSFDDEEPAPAFQREPVMAEDPAGRGRPDDERERNGREKVAGGFGAVLADEPVAEIDDHAGKERGLGSAEDEAREIKMERSVD